MTTIDKETYYKEPQDTFIIAIKDLNKFQDTCDTYEIQPTSISMTVEEITYATFNTEIAIDDLRMRYVVQGCLNRLFNSYKSVRTFEKELEIEFNLYEELFKTENKNYIMDKEDNSVLDVIYLLYAACYSVNSRASGGNASKAMKSFLKAININMDSLHLVKNLPFSKDTFLCDAYKYIYMQPHENVELIFTVTTTDLMQYLNGETSTNSIPPCAPVNVISDATVKWDERIDIKSLIANDAACKLLKELYSGSRKLSLVKLKHLAKSLCNVNGAQKALKEAIERTGQYNETIPLLIAYLMCHYRQIGYAHIPPMCRYYCQYSDVCRTVEGLKLNYLKGTFKKNKHIHCINSSKLGSKNEKTVRDELYESFNNDCTSKERKIFIYKCFVGTGKTQMYIDKLLEFIEQHKTVIIALPTHALKNEIISRISSKIDEDLIANTIIIVPALPKVDDDEFNHHVNSFYSIGDYNGANNYIMQYVSQLEEDKVDIKEAFESYLNIISDLKDSSYTKGKLILATHERLLSLKAVVPDIIIIDEDIKGSILKTEIVPIAELYSLSSKLESLIKNGKNVDSISTIIDRISIILKAETGKVNSFNAEINYKDRIRTSLLHEISTDRGIYYNSKIIDLLVNDCTYIKSSNKDNEDNEVTKEVINYIYKRNLPFNNCKIFIMSATSDKEISESLYGKNNVVYHEFDIPKLKANITLDYNHPYSKEWLRKEIKNKKNFTSYITTMMNLEITKYGLVPKNNKRKPLIITFKEFEKYFIELGFDILLHFGNTTGFNEYKGKDIAIFGTYNLDPITYTLYTKAIYPEANIKKVPKSNELGEVLVSNNNYKFYIYTSKESSEYRKIQLWNIESETIQALGRARPIDNKCNIIIYSNVPPAGISLMFK